MWLLLKNALFTILVPGTVAVFVPLSAFRHGDIEWSRRCVPASVLLCVGASIYFWCLWDFAVSGRGTPAPIDPPKELVVRGLYRVSRNPMYVGVLAVIAGWALLFGEWSIALYGGAVGLAFTLFVLGYEEPHLTRVFGTAYTDYCARVGRWWTIRRRKRADG